MNEIQKLRAEEKEAWKDTHIKEDWSFAWQISQQRIEAQRKAGIEPPEDKALKEGRGFWMPCLTKEGDAS